MKRNYVEEYKEYHSAGKLLVESFLIVAVAGLFIAVGFFPGAVVMTFLGVVWIFRMLVWCLSTYLTPLFWFHRFLTNTLDADMRYKIREWNPLQIFLHAVMGNVLFYGIVVVLFLTAVSFRPFQDGYYCKEPSYEIGDAVVVSVHGKGKELGTVLESFTSEKGSPCYKVSIDGEGVLNASIEGLEDCEKICGLFFHNDNNMPKQLWNSYYGWVRYAAERIRLLFG